MGPRVVGVFERDEVVDIHFVRFGMGLRVIVVLPFSAHNCATSAIHSNWSKGARLQNLGPGIKAIVVSVSPVGPVFAVILINIDWCSGAGKKQGKQGN